MLLCLDVGNSHIYGGLFVDQQLVLQFRYPSSGHTTSDQLGVFFRGVLRENAYDHQQITGIAICSVVTSLEYSLRAAVVKYFNLVPYFLNYSDELGLLIAPEYAYELGADRLANVLAGMHLFPRRDLIIVDLGTATTVDIISKTQHYLGGVIMPGLNLQMRALHESTTKLPLVNIVQPESIVTSATVSQIQVGLYYGQLGAIREVVTGIVRTLAMHDYLVLGTGGFAGLFAKEELFTAIIPELVLDGLRLYVQLIHQQR